MRVALIYATWPVTPFGVTWYKLADSLRDAGLSKELTAAGHKVTEEVLRAEGANALEARGGFELAREIARRCRKATDGGALPVIVCGSCAVGALGAVAGLSAERTGILWMDAHPDLNTPDTSGSGLLDGMALATVLGKCWRNMAKQLAGLRPAFARDVCLYGARDIDPGENLFMTVEGIPVISAAEEAADRLDECKRVYIHLDMDVHDALQVRTNNFAVPDGPSVDEVRTMLTEAAQRYPLAAMSVTGLDPAAPDAELAISTAIDHIRAVCDNRSVARAATA
jgi:arginase